MNLSVIWKNRSEILDGIKNNIFKSEAVENIAAERMKICNTCDLIDRVGDRCLVPKTQPCCGSCGCSLKLKLRSLSSECPEGYWGTVLTDEEDIMHEELNPEEDD
jgi:hypothetical protein